MIDECPFQEFFHCLYNFFSSLFCSSALLFSVHRCTLIVSSPLKSAHSEVSIISFFFFNHYQFELRLINFFFNISEGDNKKTARKIFDYFASGMLFWERYKRKILICFFPVLGNFFHNCINFLYYHFFFLFVNVDTTIIMNQCYVSFFFFLEKTIKNNLVCTL